MADITGGRKAPQSVWLMAVIVALLMALGALAATLLLQRSPAAQTAPLAAPPAAVRS